MAALDEVDSNILAAKVLSRLGTGLAGVQVCDGVLPDTPTGPYVVLRAATATAQLQRYSQTRPTYAWDYSVIVANNSAAGVRLIGDKVRGLLDDRNMATRSTDGLWSVPDYDSGLITDDQIPGDWRHSVTYYFTGRTD